MFSVSINGELNGFFPGKKGLRQGDPLSPYLFVLCMEVLSRILNKKIASSEEFQFHWRCGRTSLSHLCFADDLMLFCHGDQASVGVIKDALDTFSSFSGLQPNLHKSDMFVAGVNEETKNMIANMVGFRWGVLPLKYLGVPLLSSKLRAVDCVELESRILKRLQSWTNKFLSYAGRLQLIQSVLFSIQSYWCFQFILPTKCIKAIEAKLRSFLWKGTSLSAKGAKVAWEEVTKPKKEGGLGIKKIKDWNRAAMSRYIWLLCNPSSTSLWAKWAHVNLLGRSQFWIAKVPWDCSWTWRKILQLRPSIRDCITYKVGDGNWVSLWFDPWLPSGPICDSLSARVIYDSGLSKFAKVALIIREGCWAWPGINTNELMALRELSTSLPQPDPSVGDKVVWRPTGAGFTIRSAWEFLRVHSDKVDWYSLVWFKYHIPRYSFILWLAVRHRLSTQDKLISHGVIQPSLCVLCDGEIESHSHLFFQCPYAIRLWFTVLGKLGLQCFETAWDDIVQWSTLKFSGDSLLQVLGKLSFSSLVYFIWKERNSRLFQHVSSEPTSVLRQLETSVRLRVLSIKPFPKTDCNRHLVKVWSLPPSIFGE